MKTPITCFLLLLLVASGCVTKSQSRANARAAFNAGRAAAYHQALEEQRTSILVQGNVKNPEIPWKDEMTLMEAIVAAECTDRRNPREINIIRKHLPEPIPVNMKSFLNGDDVLLQPGDTIEIHP